MSYILKIQDPIERFIEAGGGKAKNLALLARRDVPVPEWFCVSADAFRDFLEENHLNDFLSLDWKGEAPVNLAAFAHEVEERFLKARVSDALAREIEESCRALGLDRGFVAVRSSGLDEDSAENSFAGQFSSYLFQKGMDQVLLSLKKCWASGFSERALSYRIERGLKLTGIAVGVVIQKMVNAESAGVAFSRNPIRALDRDSVLISSVWGLGEGW